MGGNGFKINRPGNSEQELFYIGVMNESNLPESCPQCQENGYDADQGHLQSNMSLRGPFTRYRRRDNEIYFDLEEKYLACSICGTKIKVVDFQVLVDKIAETLPPEKARAFSMKMMGLYDNSRDYAIEVLSILTGDFKFESDHGEDYLKQLEELIQERVK